MFTITNPLTGNKQEDRALGSIHRCVPQNTQQGPSLTSGWCSEVFIELSRILGFVGLALGMVNIDVRAPVPF